MNKGKAAFQTLIRSVLRVPFEKKERTRIARDAVLLGEGRIGCSVNTVIYSGLLKEELAFFRAYNSALAEGILPDRASLSLTLPANGKESALKACMEAFRQAAEGEKVVISGGHTCFSGNVHVPVLTVMISGCFEGGYGTDRAPAPAPGQALLLTGFPGDAGAALLAEGRKEVLSGIFAASYLREAVSRRRFSASPEAAVLRRYGAVMHDVSEGGILGALWEFSEGYGTGFSVDLKSIPVHQETIEITEALGLNPYTLYSCGCMLAAVPDAEPVIRELHAAGIAAEVIGVIREDQKKLLLHDGEERHLDRPAPDAVLILEEFG